MRYLRTDGKETRRYQWKCGQCNNDIVPNLCQIEGGPVFPNDIPINCPNCAKLVAIFNPSAKAAPKDPPTDPVEPLGDGLLTDTLTDQDGRLHPDDVDPGSPPLADAKIIEAEPDAKPSAAPTDPPPPSSAPSEPPPLPEPKPASSTHKKSAKFW